MLNKTIIIIALTILTSQAGNFIQYNRALRIVPAYFQEGDSPGGVSLSFHYEQRLAKTVFDFSVTPKYEYISEETYYTDGNTTIVFHDTTFVDPDYSFNSLKKISIEAAILFSHRPDIKVREETGSFTFNLWRYGTSFEWEVYMKDRDEVDGYVKETTFKNEELRKYIGLTYKPTIGIQITDKLNVGVELMYTLWQELNSRILPFPKFGGGIAFRLSNPVESL